MEQLEGKAAVVTGGGSGIGFGMALAFAEAGMKVAVADIEPAAAEKVRAELDSAGAEAIAVHTDVMERSSVEALAEAAYRAFGSVELLCNNAGVTTFTTMDETTREDWDWVLGVNLFGVVNGLQAFLPRMKRQPGPKHIVNTASIAGVLPAATLGPYVASKYAVVGISESLRLEGSEWDLSCSVLCPGNVNTSIVSSGRNRPERFGGPNGEVRDDVQQAIDEGLDPREVGQIVRDAVRSDDLYIFTHPRQRRPVARRFEAILAAFDAAAER